MTPRACEVRHTGSCKHGSGSSDCEFVHLQVDGMGIDHIVDYIVTVYKVCEVIEHMTRQ